jgi:hypothetical protein
MRWYGRLADNRNWEISTMTTTTQRRQYRGITYAVARGRDGCAGWHFYLHGDKNFPYGGDCNTAKEAHDGARSTINGHLEDDR